MIQESKVFSADDGVRLSAVCDRLFFTTPAIPVRVLKHVAGVKNTTTAGANWKTRPDDVDSTRCVLYDEFLDAYSASNTARHFKASNGATITLSKSDIHPEYPITVVPSAFAATMLRAFEDTGIFAGAEIRTKRVSGSAVFKIARPSAAEIAWFAAYYTVEVARFVGEGFKHVEGELVEGSSGLELVVKFTRHSTPRKQKARKSTPGISQV